MSGLGSTFNVRFCYCWSCGVAGNAAALSKSIGLARIARAFPVFVWFYQMDQGRVEDGEGTAAGAAERWGGDALDRFNDGSDKANQGDRHRRNR